MQSTFSGLNTMVNGIYTQRLGLNTVGHNISNSNTEGYSRQTAHAAATPSSEVYTLAGASQVGNGSTVTSVIRARDIYADRQYWKENSTDGYYNGKANNYAKIESIFNDSDNSGVQNAMEKFYQAWQDCSTTASSDTSRQNVINAGQNFAQSLQIAAKQTKEQIDSLYDDISLSVVKMNRLMGQVVELNKNIAGIEATGAHANDLRDQRDLIVDQLTSMTDITVYESANGMYTLVSNGTTLVNGITKVDLEMSAPKNNTTYSLSDYDIMIKQTGTVYTPGNGELKAQFEAVAEDKGYIDQVANMAAFMFTTMNDQHKAGYGIDGSKDKPFGNANAKDNATTGLNFYGESDKIFEWDAQNGKLDVYNKKADGTKDNASKESLSGMQILEVLTVNSELTATDGHKKLATRSGERDTDGKLLYQTAAGGTTTDVTQAKKDAKGNPLPVDVNGTGDGSNAVWVAALFNCERDKTSPEVNGTDRLIGNGSLYSYYNTSMTTMGSDASNMNGRVKFQSGVMDQVENLRSSTNGVNWDEELSNMITFQQGYSACSRCLSAMDECLDKLINGTGTVGR
ncbi:MAG: flagellar hook-associated protein FlgK [Anaerovibrio sp.]|nr:flagellar hook-associated protein FlgK [Veillonellaceae bacterium]MDY4484516.1 flagellar hook-associated protein FlgK [Anaerovibrio sp.]MDY5330940.1 flagellar hook-associated protein FlgK [Anaerovibrio sp.]